MLKLCKTNLLRFFLYSSSESHAKTSKTNLAAKYFCRVVKNSIIFTVAEHVVRQALFVALVGEGTGLGSKAFFSQQYTFNLYRESDTRFLMFGFFINQFP
jgi:hypothetical protein